ncbi:hypothetical protein [Flavobacterium cerinum]|uniref:Uncharacterized protein n=1 Tax=Flavobacterium cerinum TaxID=2502784 RepID=A0A3S3U0K2_9FLAO|nr:hypothetical protein [Flavobacterium cerinum]RWX00400.1 hypothetical protein EPI11_08975 [Flavobacterium cerinum]
MERRYIYFPVLIMTSCDMLKEMNLIFEYDYDLNNGAKTNERFYIPAQSVPYIVVSFLRLPEDFEFVYHPLRDFQLILNNIEYEIIKNYFPAITCCPKLECSLYRKADTEYNIPFVKDV